MRLMIFDLDGTLVDSVPDLAAAIGAVLARRGAAPLEEAVVASMVGDGAAVLVDRAFAARGLTPDCQALGEFVAAIEGAPARSRLFDGVEAVLDRLEASGWAMAVCTNKPVLAARALLAGLGVGGRFAVVSGGDSATVRKPDPGHVRAVLEAAGAAPGEAVMVGDNQNDVRAAMGCGVAAIFAGWGYGPASMAEGAAAIAPSIKEIPGLAAQLLP